MAKSLGKWWRGRRVNCQKCGEVFELEDRDKPTESNEYFPNLEVPCPVCGTPGKVQIPFGVNFSDYLDTLK